MLSKAAITGTRVKVRYRLEGPRKFGKKKRERREILSVRVMPRTVELNIWLARRGWAPPRRCNGGRAIDFYTRRFWWLWITPRKFPPERWSTIMILDELLEVIKKGENIAPFQSIDLLRWPNKGRLIDYLAAFWYHYEGGKKKTY